MVVVGVPPRCLVSRPGLRVTNRQEEQRQLRSTSLNNSVVELSIVSLGMASTQLALELAITFRQQMYERWLSSPSFSGPHVLHRPRLSSVVTVTLVFTIFKRSVDSKYVQERERIHR